jgi:hypothetical protein
LLADQIAVGVADIVVVVVVAEAGVAGRQGAVVAAGTAGVAGCPGFVVLAWTVTQTIALCHEEGGVSTGSAVGSSPGASGTRGDAGADGATIRSSAIRTC